MYLFFQLLELPFSSLPIKQLSTVILYILELPKRVHLLKLLILRVDILTQNIGLCFLQGS